MMRVHRRGVIGLHNPIRAQSIVINSGVATEGSRGAEVPPLHSEKFAKNREKALKKSGKKRKNREEKAKIGKVLSLCPS